MNQPTTQGMNISCPNCRQPISAIVESIIDAGNNPAAKARFLSRRLNVVQCPHCGATFQLSVPLVYHDHTKELLMVYFPMELNIPKTEREHIIGEMTKAVMRNLPQEQRKGYLFNPMQPITMDGMVETILEKDGVTREMMAAQREKMKLVESFVEADDDALETMIAEYDDEIDAEFFQLVTLAAEAALSSGREDAAQTILQRRDAILELSSYGQEVLEHAAQQEAAIQEVAQRLQALGQRLDIQTFYDFVVEVGESDDHLQALVGLVRNALDYNFFTYMSEQIDQEADPDQKAYLTEVRDRLVELTQMVDEQQQMMVQQAQLVLRDILNAPDMDQAIAERLPMIDELFLSILGASIQGAEQRGDLLNASRLKTVYEKVMTYIRAAAPPEVQFINELLSQEDPLEARLLLTERAGDYGQPLVDYMEALIQNMAQRGDDAFVQHLTELRDAAARIIAPEG